MAGFQRRRREHRPQLAEPSHSPKRKSETPVFRRFEERALTTFLKGVTDAGSLSGNASKPRRTSLMPKSLPPQTRLSWCRSLSRTSAATRVSYAANAKTLAHRRSSPNWSKPSVETVEPPSGGCQTLEGDVRSSLAGNRMARSPARIQACHRRKSCSCLFPHSSARKWSNEPIHHLHLQCLHAH